MADWLRLDKLGLALVDKGDIDAGAYLFRQALALNPGFARGHCHLAAALQMQGRTEGAERHYRQAVVLGPNDFEIHYAYGTLLESLGRYAEAESCYRKALAINPNSRDAIFNLGNLLHDQGRLADAERQYRRLLRLSPHHQRAAFNLALLFEKSSRFAEAEAAYREILARWPRHEPALNNLGILLAKQQRAVEAEGCFRRLLALNPDLPGALSNLGVLLVEQRRWEEALSVLCRARELDADDGQVAAKIPYVKRCLCAWGDLFLDETAVARLAAKDFPTGIVPFERLSSPTAGAVEQRHVARLYADHAYLQGINGDALVKHFPGVALPGGRLRVGYLSADYHDHPVMTQIRGVLKAHDRARFEIYAYSLRQSNEHERGGEAECDHFVDLSRLSDELAAERIANDHINILVDLMGYTSGSRQGITARRPAPILVNWLGYPGTLGHPRLADYIIGDSIVTPAEHAGHFSETIVRMPHCYLPNDRERIIGTRPTRQEAGLPDTGFVFCSFNQSFKYNPETFDVWCRLLREVPNSVLWLQKPVELAVANLQREMATRGVAPTRLIFAERLPTSEEHLGRLQLADLALDTFPYTSHSTGCDALWVGVPMVTRLGDTFASRVGASLLHAVNLAELVAENWEDYFALAKSLAQQPARLAAVREKLRRQRLTAPLFDTRQFARDLEGLYANIWRSLTPESETILHQREV